MTTHAVDKVKQCEVRVGNPFAEEEHTTPLRYVLLEVRQVGRETKFAKCLRPEASSVLLLLVGLLDIDGMVRVVNLERGSVQISDFRLGLRCKFLYLVVAVKHRQDQLIDVESGRVFQTGGALLLRFLSLGLI